MTVVVKELNMHRMSTMSTNMPRIDIYKISYFIHAYKVNFSRCWSCKRNNRYSCLRIKIQSV